MSTQRTLILLKPDCVERRQVGEVIRRFEAKGLKIVGMKFRKLARELLEEHYAEHREKPFFDGVVSFVTSGPVVAMCLEGQNAIAVSRSMIGATRSYEAAPGSIRGDLGLSGQFNLIHGSDSPESAERELKLWFRPEELVDYELPDEKWLNG